MYPYLELGTIRIPMYSLMTALGVLVAMIIAYFLIYKKEKISSNTGIRILICCAVSAVAMWFGASFFDSLFHSIESGTIGIYGITYLGGVVVGFPVCILLFHFFVPVAKGRALYLFSIIVPLVVLAHAFGRIGCFFGGCCFGRPTDSWIGIVFPPGSSAAKLYPATDGSGYSQPVIPTMLIESAFEFLLFGLMMIFRKKIKGHELEIYLIVYPIFRFIIEFFRGDNRGSTGFFLSPAQLLDLFCLAAGIMIILFYKRIVFKKTYAKCLEWQEEVKKNAKIKKKMLEEYTPEKRIGELFKLKEQGIISEEEFEKKKKKLLDEI